MSLIHTPELLAFLTTYFADSDPEAPDGDKTRAQAFTSASPPALRQQVIDQAKKVIGEGTLSVEDVGMQTNQWFEDAQAALAWLGSILSILENAETGTITLAVKDSNGAVLSEGDSVQVIKDLKVKGGSSDLKRGTLIKKIHLIDDTENIECRVDGSTLVLKTCFLKKA